VDRWNCSREPAQCASRHRVAHCALRAPVTSGRVLHGARSRARLRGQLPHHVDDLGVAVGTSRDSSAWALAVR
jgi:hypothetical protein